MDFAQTCTPELLEKLVLVALRTESHELRKVVEDKWYARFRANEVPAAFSLDVGESHQLASFLGDIYYTHLLRLCSPSALPKPRGELSTIGLVGPPTLPFDGEDLNDVHVHRLYKGFISLSMAWDSMSILKLEAPSKTEYCRLHSCYSWDCLQSGDVWKKLYLEASQEVALPSVLGRLAVIDRLSRKLLAESRAPCMAPIVDAVNTLHARIVTQLPDHFGIAYKKQEVPLAIDAISISGESLVSLQTFCFSDAIP